MALDSLQLYPGPTDFPTSAPATPVAETATSPPRQGLAFDGATNESVAFPFIMPEAYAGGTLTLHVEGKMASATSGDVDLDGEVEARDAGANESLTADSYDTVNSQDNNSVPGVAGDGFEIAITLTNDDNVVAGDLVRIRLTRDAAADTATGDFEVYAVDIRES